MQPHYSLRDYNVGIFFAWLNKLLMHQFYGSKVLIHHRIQSTPSFPHISEYSAYYANISIRIYECLDVEHIKELFILKNQYSFYNYNLCGFNGYSFIYTIMYGKIVNRSFDRAPFLKRFDMIYHKIRVKCVGMVVIQFFSFFERYIIMLFIIEIMAEYRLKSFFVYI